jgi:hypothetical protein
VSLLDVRLLEDVRAAGLDVRLGSDGRLQVRGSADIKARLEGALRRRARELTVALRFEMDPCCGEGPHGCDHVWCDACGDWGHDTSFGCSAHPRHTGQKGCPCEACWPGRVDVIVVAARQRDRDVALIRQARGPVTRRQRLGCECGEL